MAAIAWGVGVVAFVAVAAVIPELDLRVEMGFLVGATVSTLVMAWALAARMRAGVDEGIDSLITRLEHEPLEL
jgi:hypothetical protein